MYTYGRRRTAGVWTYTDMHRLLAALAVVAGHQPACACAQQADDITTMPPVIPASLQYFGFYAVMLGGEESFAFSNFVFDWPTNINTTVLSRDAGPAL